MCQDGFAAVVNQLMSGVDLRSASTDPSVVKVEAAIRRAAMSSIVLLAKHAGATMIRLVPDAIPVR